MTMVNPYGVAIIIGTEFDELEALSARIHVWAPNVPKYAAIARARKPPVYSIEHGITLYKYDASENAEETFLSWIDTVDEHHGEFSHDPPWTFLEIHGLKSSLDVSEALADFGVSEIRELDDGFVATRRLTIW